MANIVSWEPEGCYCSSKMFPWEPEGCYCCTKSMAIAPFWFSTEHLWSAIAPFWLSADDMTIQTNREQERLLIFIILFLFSLFLQLFCIMHIHIFLKQDKSLQITQFKLQTLKENLQVIVHKHTIPFIHTFSYSCNMQQKFWEHNLCVFKFQFKLCWELNTEPFRQMLILMLTFNLTLPH